MFITVNGVAITEAAIALEAQNHPARDPQAAVLAAAEALAIRELLLQEARQSGIVATPASDADGRRETEEDALIDALIAGAVRVPEADEAACRRYYDNNPTRFRSADLYEAAHILFAADPKNRDAYAEAVRRAGEAIAVLQAEPERFAALARDLSACPSAATGGNLGQIARGDTVPEFETFLLNLEPGQLCPVPVKTPYGAHVLRLDRKIVGTRLPFEALRERIADYLTEASFRRGFAQYVRVLAGQAKITGIDLDGAQSPLVR